MTTGGPINRRMQLRFQGVIVALAICTQAVSPALASSRGQRSRVTMPLPPPSTFLRGNMGAYPPLAAEPGRNAQLSRLRPIAGVPGRWFGLLSAAGVATAYTLDRRVWQTWSDTGATSVHRTADAAARLGDLRYLGPALLASYAIGRATRLPGMSSASARIGFSVLSAGAACGALKIATGRARPDSHPGESGDFSPFSGNDAFPSGHTTVAFSFASALTQETNAAWVPWVAYPAAAAVGWARVVQDRHWLSDVVAGAALGTWAGREIDLRLQRRQKPGVNASPLVRLSGRRARVGIAVRF